MMRARASEMSQVSSVREGILKTTGIGLVLGTMTAAAGSIWPAVVLHAVVDLQGGLLGYAVLGRRAAARVA